MKITFEGTGLYDVIAQMEAFIMDAMPNSYSGSETVPEEVAEEPKPEKPKKSPKKAAKPEPEKDEAEPEVDSDKDPAEAKREAIDALMSLYNDGKAEDVKALLVKFGVKKFGEIPDERGVELLDAANDLCKDAA